MYDTKILHSTQTFLELGLCYCPVWSTFEIIYIKKKIIKKKKTFLSLTGITTEFVHITILSVSIVCDEVITDSILSPILS